MEISGSLAEKSSFKHIVYDKEDGVAKITINRPEVSNAMNLQTNQELFDALKDAESDDLVRVVIITGTGNSFSAGKDLKSAGVNRVSQYADTTTEVNVSRESRRFMEQMRKPIIAVINGYAFGGGLELALHCDIRIASKNAKIGLTETSVGQIPSNGGAVRLPRLVGIGRAKEMIFLAKRITGEEAERIGLVNQAVDQGDIWKVVSEYVSIIKENAPLSIAYAKAALYKTMNTGPEEGSFYEKYYGLLNSQTDDAEEGKKAFLEKRKPIWKFK